MRRPGRALALAAAALALGTAARADLLRHCAPPPALDAAQHDRLLAFAALIRDELERSGQPLAIVARSGLDLARFGLRYSHAGVALRASGHAPWAVRQLYYDCDEGRPRLFDQGLSGFVLGLAEPERGHVALLLLPAEAAAALERRAHDDALALALLGSTYSANAHAFGLRYQNCNQWLVELLAAAWAPGGADSRAAAQDWLRAQGYRPTRFELAWRPWLWFGLASPWLHVDDHPATDVEAGVLQVSMPDSITAFAQAQWPAAQRLEFCRAGTRVVLRRDGAALDADCTPGPGDRVVALE